MTSAVVGTLHGNRFVGSECRFTVTLCTDGGTSKPVSASYVAPGTDQPYTFTFHADVFHSGKISSIKATSDKDDVVVKSSENGSQAQVSDGCRIAT